VVRMGRNRWLTVGAVLAVLVAGGVTWLLVASGACGCTSPPRARQAVTCTTTVAPGMSASAIAGAVVAASDGSTICMRAGRYPDLTITGAEHGSYVTIRPVPGERVIVPSWEIRNSAFLRFVGLTSVSEGWRVTDEIHDMQWIDNYFTGNRGLVLGAAMAAKRLLIEDNTFEKIKIPNEDCRVAPGVGQGQAITMEYADGVTITHNKFKEVIWHYIQGGGGPGGAKVEYNLFEGPMVGRRAECTHLNVWQIFDGGENDTFSNNIVRGKPGRPAAVTPILFEHGVPAKDGPYPCSHLYTNIKLENNLFIDSAAAFVVQISNTDGLTYSRNTVVGGEYGVWLDRSDICGAGTDLTADRNIVVETQSVGAPQRFVLGECHGACGFDYNVSDDTTAGALGSTHHVVRWAPSWATTANGHAGFYIASGLPFSAGYDGTGGP
jgi:hypothetical protein